MSEEEPDDADFAELLGELESRMLPGGRHYSLSELAEQAGATALEARVFWRAMGFPRIASETEHLFTDDDVAALRRSVELVVSERMDFRTAISMTRSTGYSMDRLVLWHIEALIEDATRQGHVDDLTARRTALRKLSADDGLLATIEQQVSYAFRRQFVAIVRRYFSEISAAEAEMSPDLSGEALPLTRAVGFADVASYTRKTAELGLSELADFIGHFESVSRDIVAEEGGRVVKTLGDEVIFVTDDVVSGARIALRLVETMAASPLRIDIHAGLVWGRLLSRFGDVFGPKVNLAARLSDEADAGQILVDERTAALLAGAGDFTLEPLPLRELEGLGPIRPVALSKKTPQIPSTV